MRIAIQNKNALLSELIVNKQAIRSFGVSKLSIFGSFATGNIKKESDVDFLVEFNPAQKNYDNFIGLSFYLEDLLGRKVELVTRQSLCKHIGPHILNQAEHVAI